MTKYRYRPIYLLFFLHDKNTKISLLRKMEITHTKMRKTLQEILATRWPFWSHNFDQTYSCLNSLSPSDLDLCLRGDDPRSARHTPQHKGGFLLLCNAYIEELVCIMCYEYTVTEQNATSKDDVRLICSWRLYVYCTAKHFPSNYLRTIDTVGRKTKSWEGPEWNGPIFIFFNALKME